MVFYDHNESTSQMNKNENRGTLNKRIYSIFMSPLIPRFIHPYRALHVITYYVTSAVE